MRKTMDTKNYIKTISAKYNISMKDTKNIINEYRRLIDKNIILYKNTHPPINFGILGIDHVAKIYPGMISVYSFENIGKTSILKKIAISLKDQGLNVVYWDTDNKLFLHDIKNMEGIVLANAKTIGLKHLIYSKTIDVIIVDTLTSMTERTALIRNMKDLIPYMIFGVQMRYSINKKKSVPACYETTLSGMHTKIFLTNTEQITIEGIKVNRVQYKIEKYKDKSTTPTIRGSFIIKDGIVDNLYSAYDYLKTTGRIRSVGFTKFLDNEDIGGKIKDISNDPVIVEKIISAANKGIIDNK